MSCILPVNCFQVEILHGVFRFVWEVVEQAYEWFTLSQSAVTWKNSCRKGVKKVFCTHSCKQSREYNLRHDHWSKARHRLRKRWRNRNEKQHHIWIHGYLATKEPPTTQFSMTQCEASDGYDGIRACVCVHRPVDVSSWWNRVNLVYSKKLT